MPQKKEKKKVIKKVTKTVIKNGKIQPLLKNSINIKIDLDDDNEKKKKPKRKKRQQKQANETANNDGVSYVDEVGRPISNEIINKSFTGSYMPQPFGKNSTVIGTSFNESAIMDRVMEKMSKLNATSNMNQSMNNNTSLNQSVSTPQRPARRIAPPQLIRPTPTPTPRLLLKPRPTPSAIQFSTVPMQFLSPAPSSLEPPQLPRQAAPSTIAPASPSVEAFNLLSLAPEPARSQIEPVSEEFISASSRAAEMSKEELLKIFGNMSTNDMDVIINTTFRVGPILKGKNKSGQSSSFISKFKEIYQGGIGQQTAASKAWKFYRQINQI